MSEDDVPEPEFRDDAERAFYMSLVHDEDVIAVLRGHLYVEHAVHDVLKARLGRDAEVVHKGLSFATKCSLGRRLQLLSTVQARELKALGELRNSFAHTLERSLTVEDDERMLNAVDDVSRDSIWAYFAKWPERAVVGSITRLAILLIRADIASTASILQKYADEGRAVVNVNALDVEKLYGKS